MGTLVGVFIQITTTRADVGGGEEWPESSEAGQEINLSFCISLLRVLNFFGTLGGARWKSLVRHNRF